MSKNDTTKTQETEGARLEPRFSNSTVQELPQNILVEQDDDEVIIRIKKSGDFGLTSSQKMITVANTVGFNGLSYVTVVDEEGNDKRWTLKVALWKPVSRGTRRRYNEDDE